MSAPVATPGPAATSARGDGGAPTLLAIPVAVAAVVLAVPGPGTLPSRLALANACLNATALTMLVAGWLAAREGRLARHRDCMVGALGASTLFLVSYLARFALTGAHRYPAHDWTRTVYLAVLGSHTVLAAILPPLVGRALWLALRGRRAAHRRLARVTLPIWVYVSATGVAVYVLLYHVAPARG